MYTLVTGGTGFVISNLLRELGIHGHQIISLDVTPPDSMVNDYLKPWAEQVHWIEGDVLSSTVLNDIAMKYPIKRIVHGAAITPGRGDIEVKRSRQIVDINLQGTVNLLELASQIRVERFVYVSSSAVYWKASSSEGPQTEATPLEPHGLYSVTKYVSELLTRRYGELHGFEVASVRLGGPYGPMERVTGHRTNMSQLYQWTGQAIRGETITPEPQEPRDYTYVGDIVAGIRTVLDASVLPNDVYNLASGVGISLDELLLAFEKVVPEAKFSKSPPAQRGSRIENLSRGILSIDLIKDDLGFEPQYDLQSGLSSYMQWRKEYQISN